MNRIEQIIARCKEIDGLQAGIETEAELTNNGQFTEEQRSKYSELKAEFDKLIAEKQQIESDAAMRASRAGRGDLLQPAALPRKSDPNAGSPLQSQGQQLPGTPIQAETQVATGKKFTIPANVQRHTPKNFSEREGLSGDERAYRFGQYCLAKIANDLPGRYSFPEATSFVNAYMGGIRNVAHGNDATTGGHFLVPEEFSSDLLVLRENYGVARRIFGREPMSSDTKHVPKSDTGLTAYFVNESDAITESNATWQDIMLVAKDVASIARISNQLSADAVISVGDQIAGWIAYAFANKEDECAFNGTGTSTYGGIRGARFLMQNITGTTDSAGLVTQATGNTWSALTATDLTAVVGKLPDYADTPNTVWVCHRAFYYGVMERLLLAQGGATAMEAKNGVGRPRPMYLGYPVEFSQVMPSTTATTDVPLLLGDFSLGAKFGDRQQVSIMFSEHAYVNSQSVFERNQIAVRGTERFDIVVHGCGTSSAAGPIVGLQTGS